MRAVEIGNKGENERDTNSVRARARMRPISRRPPSKRVITLDPIAFASAARELFEQMVASGFEPDLVVGIANGGVEVVAAMDLPDNVVTASCALRRPSTAAKERAGWVFRALRHLPYAGADRLRILEDWWAARKPVVVPAPSPLLVDHVRSVSEVVRARGLRSIAVVDDAVDSGATLACVIAEVRAQLPECEVRSAAITRTRLESQTVEVPDFNLYALTLCRFPWAYDYKAAKP